MFVIVLAVKGQGVTQAFAKALNGKGSLFKYGVVSYLACNLINNIPMSVLFSTFASSGGAQAIYATIIGSNVGAFLTPVGALAGIMFTDLVKKQGVKFGFKDFIVYGIIISVPTLLCALIGLMIIL